MITMMIVLFLNKVYSFMLLTPKQYSIANMN